MKDWSNYQNSTYGNNVSNLLINFLNNHNVSNAIDLGCGSGNDTLYLINTNKFYKILLRYLEEL